MKSYLKIFVIAFICFTCIFSGGALAYMKLKSVDTTLPVDEVYTNKPSEPIDDELTETKIEDEKTELEMLIEDSDRTNILLLGFEGPRTDLIILASFDKKDKVVDLISVPRDTYYYKDEYLGTKYDTLGHRKINASHIRGGVEETTNAVSEILCNIPIDAYVSVTYQGVENIVDSLGGVKVNIPMDMDYDDPDARPQLHIHFTKGEKELNGKESIKFLRYRKNNDGTGYPDGDLGRVRAQQQFIKSASKKAMSFRLPIILHTAFKFVDTDLDLKDIAFLANDAKDINMDDINTYMLPGETTYDGVSYYKHNEEEVEKLLIDIYKGSLEE